VEVDFGGGERGREDVVSRCEIRELVETVTESVASGTEWKATSCSNPDRHASDRTVSPGAKARRRRDVVST
jgi:hypothetical protein